MTSRQWWIVGIVAALVLVGLGVFALTRDSGGDGASASPSPTPSAAPTSPSAAPTTPSAAPTSPSPSPTTPAPTPTTAPPPSVTQVTAAPGGGSGEIVLDWLTVAGATAYRVEHASSVGGPFTVAASVDVVTGKATSVPEVVNLWSSVYSYIPPSGSAPPSALPTSIQYVEVASGQRWFRVIASNAAGAAPASPVVSATPQ